MHSLKGSLTLLAAAVFAGAATLAVPADAAAQTHGHDSTSMASDQAGAADHGMAPPAADAHPFEKQMYADMTKMMRDMHAPGYTGNPDIDFMTMMIPHHQGAIDMAELVLEHGRDPQVRRLAEEIIVAQRKEIDFMTRHIATLKKYGTGEDGGHGAAMPAHQDSQ